VREEQRIAVTENEEAAHGMAARRSSDATTVLTPPEASSRFSDANHYL
jgi:hypothetical protein